MNVWSYGGGVQTAAIAVLVVGGRLPRPDLVVMADTGREATVTWDYLAHIMTPYLAGAGLTVEIAPHHLATVDLYGKNGDLLIPAFTKTGKLPTFCSTEWKRRVVRRYLRQQAVKRCQLWLGISVDELERAHTSDVRWMENVYPLLTMVPMRRGECLALVEQAGLPKPPRSACWMCPQRNDADWVTMKRTHPGDFQKAEALEKEMMLRDKQSGVFLHRSRIPLGAVGLKESDAQTLLLECESGFCWT